jgi:integrase
MARATHGITDTQIEALKPRAGGTERIVRDGKVPGLLLRVGPRKRTWYLRIEKSPAWNFPLGQYPDVGADKARRIAEAKWKRHADGLPFDDPKPREPSIDTLWPMFKTWLQAEGRSPKTVDGYSQSYKRLSAEVRSRPLRELAEQGSIMREEQERIRQALHNTKRGGMAASTAVARFVSSLSSWAVKQDHVKLDGNPVRSARLVDPKRRDLPALGPDDLAAWYASVSKLDREQHREAHLFALLSGLRRNDLVTLEWKNLDLKRRCIRIPNPKGGVERGFDLVLSRPMLRCLWRARSIGRRLFRDNAQRWAFPSALGHVRGDALTKDGVLSNHSLRRTYATLARDAGVDEDLIGKLLNHGGTTITSRYVRNSFLGRMKAAAQADISAHIVRLLGSPRGVA